MINGCFPMNKKKYSSISSILEIKAQSYENDSYGLFSGIKVILSSLISILCFATL